MGKERLVAGSTSSAGFREKIWRIALLNALNHKGKAIVNSVLGKTLAQYPDFRTSAAKVASIVAEIVQEVNMLSSEDQRKLVLEKWPKDLIKEKHEEGRTLPPLPRAGAYRQVITRFAPNPDCLLHLGSARAIILSYQYAKMHRGLFYLRFEDTDPRLKKSALPFYRLIREDVSWLGCPWDAEFIQSDRLSLYYEHAERILSEGNAYVCICEREEFRQKIRLGQSCSCRNQSSQENLERWKHMLDGTYREGKAVVRIRTDLDHPNPAVRDWPALRIIDTKKHTHPRVGSKYHVWPLYNFSSGIDDHLMGVTHIIRGKEHLTNQTRQEYLYRHFKWDYPTAIHYGRLKITGASLSKSVIVQGLKNGKFRDWDDPRLATFAALRKRGITAEAIRRLMIDVGPKSADVTLSWKNLYAHNRKTVDSFANRYFFVHNPKMLIVREIPHSFSVNLHLHPDYPGRGFRSVTVRPKTNRVSFWISSDDLKLMKRKKRIRLMGLFNLQVQDLSQHEARAVFQSESHNDAKRANATLIHWLLYDTGIPCEVIMPNTDIVKGLAESSCKGLKPDSIIQFERFGFVRVDSVDGKLITCFAHR